MTPAGDRAGTVTSFDVVVVGSGPAGQSAAITAARAGRSVLVVERERAIGGECLHRGTIPSKTLRETVLAHRALSRRSGRRVFDSADEVTMASLVARLDEVVSAQEASVRSQLAEHPSVTIWHGHARFASPHELLVISPGGASRRVQARHVVLACGSRPRRPDGVDVDHEVVLDSDSILSMTYLPRSLVVLGAGVVASEYASIFASLGVAVTMVDAGPRPMAFLDEELTSAFTRAFEASGGRLVLGAEVVRAAAHAVAGVDVELAGGEILHADKVFCALGRAPNVAGLGLERIGVALTRRGHVAVDESCRTALAHVYAVGDIIGPPALASVGMEQGRRAVRHALALPSSRGAEILPFCAYTIPDIASVGLDEAAARARHGGAVVGRARYRDLARAQIAGHADGIVKLVTSPDGTRLLGAQVVGDGASELVHVAQMALVGACDVDVFVETTFNFPTLAEGLRVAALDVLGQREAVRRAA